MSIKGFMATFLCFLLLLFLFLFLNREEKMQYYKVQVEGEEISYFVLENTKKIYIKDVLENTIQNKGEVEKSSSICKKARTLRITKYTCTNEVKEKQIDCKPFYAVGREPHLVEMEQKPKKMQILFQEKVLYDGEYKENIDSILKEPGRYYFIITYETIEKKKEKTAKILFSIKVGATT